jgi:two-component system response regulator MprA
VPPAPFALLHGAEIAPGLLAGRPYSKKDANVPGSVQPPQRSLLFVDDDETTRDAMREFLEDHGFRVLVACDGYEALEMVDHDRPSVVVTDLDMPGMRGDEVVRQVRARSRDTPVILITAHREIDARRLAREAGADAFLNKPINFDGFLRLLERYP